MTLQQLRYLIKVAESASLGAAAAELHISQPSLSVAIRNLERELGRELFNRAPGGMTLTLDGLEFLGYARQLLQQVNVIEKIYKDGSDETMRFSLSTQHYTFIVEAFIKFVREFENASYALNFRETTTSGIIEDVRAGYSELGVLFCSSYNERIMRGIFAENNLAFTDIVWQRPHALMSKCHPLAAKKSLRPDELEPFPRVIYDRGRGASVFFAEEVLCERPRSQSITVTDRSTVGSILQATSAYNLGIGILPDALGNGIVAVPLETSEYIRIIYIRRANTVPTPLAESFLARLGDVLAKLPPGLPPPCRD